MSWASPIRAIAASASRSRTSSIAAPSRPSCALISSYLTRKVRRWIDPRFTVSFGGIEEPEDFAARAEAFAQLIPLGVVSPAQAARLLHLPTPERPR